MEITSGDDIIDSRDVIERIRELESELEDCVHCGQPVAEEEPGGILACTDTEITDEARYCTESGDHLHYLDRDAEEELKALKALEEEASSAPDWPYGETLIRDGYFEDYARQLAEDIGAITSDMGWPMDYIDWKAASDALKTDYISVTFGGEEYWIRA